MNKNLRLIIGTIIILFLIYLGADIIRDILILIFKDSLNKSLFRLIHFILIYTFIMLLLKTKTIKQFQKEIEDKFKKKK